MQNDESRKRLQFIRKQFLCNVPLKEFCWQGIDFLNENLQQELINNTVRLNSILKFPISIDYQKAFLKHLLEYLERQGSVIDDSVYEEYARLVALPKNNINFKHYTLETVHTKDIILTEDIHLISEGTTGLRTWQASLALCEWILSNRSHFNSKRIIELGSGIGLTGLVISLCCQPSAVYLTDCHLSVLKALCDNVILNFGQGKYNVDKQFLLEETLNSCVVTVVNLYWEDVSLELCQKLGHLDLIVAADVVYDRSIFKALLYAINNFFKYCGAAEFILSCTERNKETLDEFLELLSNIYKICEIEVPLPRNFLWSSASIMRIFSITPGPL